MADAYLSIGSNLNDRKHNIEKAIYFLGKDVGEIIKKSNLYISEAWGYSSNNKFLNSALHIRTKAEPNILLFKIQSIEKQLGRTKRENTYQDRVIDIDILFYDDLIIHSEKLSIPHPFVHLRKFCLLPMNELSPQLIHPVLKKTILQLIQDCKDDTNIQIIKENEYAK